MLVLSFQAARIFTSSTNILVPWWREIVLKCEKSTNFLSKIVALQENLMLI